MYPVINVFGKEITTYAIMALIGILLLIFLAIKWSKRFKVDDNDVILLILWAAVGVLVGSHLLYGIVNIDLIRQLIVNFDQIDSVKEFFTALFTIFGGSVFYGGLIGGLVAGYIYLKKQKMNINLYSYIVAPMIPLFHFFGRIGCFLAGCCYGIESKIGFVFEHSLIESANHVRRFPIQLVEAGFNLILFMVLYILQKKNKCKDSLLAVYLLVYSIGRFIFEFFRGDTYRGFLLGLSTSQIISILVFGGSIIYLIRLKIKKKNANILEEVKNENKVESVVKEENEHVVKEENKKESKVEHVDKGENKKKNQVGDALKEENKKDSLKNNSKAKGKNNKKKKAKK